MYIPWWAKGEYARKNGTTFRMRDGTTIVGGKIHVRGSGDFTPPPGVMWTGEVPPPDPRPAKVRKAPDAAQQLLAQHPTRDLRANLCDRFQLPHTILDGPNAGVVSMRLLNAIRKALK
jgi:hypothetical protein